MIYVTGLRLVTVLFIVNQNVLFIIPALWHAS